MARTATKDRVYLALVEGVSIRDAARALKIDEKTVRFHANDLVGREVLKRTPSRSGMASKFARGVKAFPYEQSIPSRRNTDRVGSGAGAPKIALRVHRGGCAFEVRGAVDGIPWKSRWSAQGVPNFALRDAEGNRFWLVKERGAPHRLMVQPSDEWVYDPQEVAGARAARVERVRELAAAFVVEHGLKFASVQAYEFQPVEYAAEMPGLQKFGTPGESYVWVDGSPGDGRLELETQDVRMAGAIVAWPTFEDRLTALETANGHALRAVGSITRILEGMSPAKDVRPAKPLPPEHDPGVA